MNEGTPTAGSRSLPAEEYELPQLGHQPLDYDQPEAGPSRPRRASRTQGSSRKLTIHAAPSTSVLFSAAAPSLSPRQRQTSNGGYGNGSGHRRSSSYPNPESPIASTPRRYAQAHFLDEGPDYFGGAQGRHSEEVSVPNIGHMLGFNPDDEDHYAVAAAMRSQWKKRLYLLMEEPSSGREAFYIHIGVTAGIIFSAILTVLSTLPTFHTNPDTVRLLFGLDTTVVILFTIEYLTRSLAHSDSWSQYYRWSTSFFAILDFIAIFPYYIEVARNDDTSILFRFSILRTFRLLRVFRSFKYQNQMLLTIEVMYVAVQRSKDALVALSFFILLVLVFFATLIYFAERGSWDTNLGMFVDADGDPSMFDSIPQTAWFALVTMSTVGYGDVVPRSFLGKLLTMPLLMFGLLLIALPSFVLGRNFAIVFDAMNNQAMIAPSPAESPRSSIEGPRPRPPSSDLHSFPPRPDSSSINAPLLPTNAIETPSAYTPQPSAKPAPATAGGGLNGRTPVPRMWDGAMDGPGDRSTRDARDLTNTKLAKNQLVLHQQIESLRRTVDRQSEMMRALMAALAVKDAPKLEPTRSWSAERRSIDKDRDQFTVGDSDDEDHQQR